MRRAAPSRRPTYDDCSAGSAREPNAPSDRGGRAPNDAPPGSARPDEQPAAVAEELQA
jgi:hypothetical protein